MENGILEDGVGVEPRKAVRVSGLLEKNLGFGGLGFDLNFVSVEVLKSNLELQGSSYPNPRCPHGREGAGIGMWEFLEWTLPHRDPGSDPKPGKVPPGGVSSAPESGGSPRQTRIRELLAQGGGATSEGTGTFPVPPWHWDGTIASPPRALGDFIPLDFGVPHPRDGGSWLGSYGIQMGGIQGIV